VLKRIQVSGEAQGSDQAIQDFIKVLKTGPRMAVVSKMEQAEIDTKDDEEKFRALR
jgi:acylphosphatase